jgi:hypothetical protein
MHSAVRSRSYLRLHRTATNGEREQTALDTLVSVKSLCAGRTELVSGEWLWLLNDGDDNGDNNKKIILRLKLDKARCYGHTPKPREKCNESKVTKLYNQPRKRSTTIRTSKSNIIIHGKDIETCLLIDFKLQEIQTWRRKTPSKFLKFKDLTTLRVKWKKRM